MVFVPDIKAQRTAGVFTIQRQIIAHAVVKILLAVGNANEEGRNRDTAKGRLLLIVSRSGRVDRIGRGTHIIYVNRCYRGAWDGGILVGIQMARALCFNRHLTVTGCGSGVSAVLRRKARNADDELSFPGVCQRKGIVQRDPDTGGAEELGEGFLLARGFQLPVFDLQIGHGQTQRLERVAVFPHQLGGGKVFQTDIDTAIFQLGRVGDALKGNGFFGQLVGVHRRGVRQAVAIANPFHRQFVFLRKGSHREDEQQKTAHQQSSQVGFHVLSFLSFPVGD